MNGYLIFYKPPCGIWYVHSHKIYPTLGAAKDAIKRFLPRGTPTAIRSIDLVALEASL